MGSYVCDLLARIALHCRTWFVNEKHNSNSTSALIKGCKSCVNVSRMQIHDFLTEKLRFSAGITLFSMCIITRGAPNQLNPVQWRKKKVITLKFCSHVQSYNLRSDWLVSGAARLMLYLCHHCFMGSAVSSCGFKHDSYEFSCCMKTHPRL